MYIYLNEDHVKKLIAVYFNRFGKRAMKEKNPARIVGIVQFILSLLQNNNTPYDLKPEIRIALETLINMESNNTIKLELAKKLL